MIGHFPEGAQVVELLAQSRRQGFDFETAWTRAVMHVRRGRLDSNPRWADLHAGLRFARPAFERAYLRRPPVRQDVVALALLHVMEHLYDQSCDAESRMLGELMEAA